MTGQIESSIMDAGVEVGAKPSRKRCTATKYQALVKLQYKFPFVGFDI